MFKLCRRQKSPRKKNKKDHTKIYFYFIFFVMLVSLVVRFQNFIPFWPFLFSTFFFLQITRQVDATHVEQLNHTDRLTIPNTLLRKIDDVAIKTTEISRRKEKTKKNKEQSVRYVYISTKKSWLFSFFVVVSEFWKIESFPFLPFVDIAKLHDLWKYEWLNLVKLKRYETWKPWGLGPPPAHHLIS